jgi:predicted nucleotidyltransferase
MSPSELAKCRENLKRQWENRRADKELLQRAWETAYRVATVLYQDFGAAKIAVFGSLAEHGCFTKASDIDIAVWGLSDVQHRDARYEIANLCSEFKIDLINFEASTGLFRERVQRQAIPLKKADAGIDRQLPYKHSYLPTIARNGTIYEMNQIKLIQRITDERAKIERVISSITELLREIEVAVPRHRKFFEELTAKKLAEVYSGTERIFERIAREVDMHTPRGSQWHNNLLKQMAERRPERPPVISEKTLPRLKELLDFRHKVNNIYGDELIYAKAEEHAKPIEALFAIVSEELDTFIAFLTEPRESDEKR